METITKILHIGARDEFTLIARLLSDVHHRDYQLLGSKPHQRAIDEILSSEYDVILLDYHWGRDGEAKDLLATAIAQGCDIPILVMTDEMEADVDREAIQQGASDYLIKGRIDSQLLERTVRYAIERKQAEIKLARLAHYDPLTDVPNRILFRDRIKHAIEMAERDNTTFTLMYMDLDGFKQVNDTFGHEVGDQLIRSCAARLVECMRRSDSVARMGGDEFTVLLEHTASNTDVAKIASKMISAIEKTHVIEGLDIQVQCSIGIATYPDAGRDANTLLRNADKAMYRAKLDDVSSYRFFTEAMNVEVQRQILLEADLRRAVERNEFAVAYQPRVELHSQKTIGFQAVVRWYHPVRGWLEAKDYYDLAESSGLIVPILEWAFKQICDDLHCLRQAKIATLPVCLNLTLRVINDAAFLKQLKGYRTTMRAESQHIELVLDEAMLISHYDTVTTAIGHFEQWGYAAALCGVGEQLSALSLLIRSAIKRLEVAPSVLESIAADLSSAQKPETLTLLLAMAQHLQKQFSFPALGDQTIDLLQQTFAREAAHACSVIKGAPLAMDNLLRRQIDIASDCSKA